MARSRAEVVAAAMLAEWRALARLGGEPSERVMRAARETVIGLVAQDLLAEALSGLVAGDGGEERWVVAQRWSLAPAKPPLRPSWPVTRLPPRIGHVRFVLRLRPNERWEELPPAQRREIAEPLPLELEAAESEEWALGRLEPIRAEPLPGGGYLVLEGRLTPSTLADY